MAGEDRCQGVLRSGMTGSALSEDNANAEGFVEVFIRADACQVRTASVASPLL